MKKLLLIATLFCFGCGPDATYEGRRITRGSQVWETCDWSTGNALSHGIGFYDIGDYNRSNWIYIEGDFVMEEDSAISCRDGRLIEKK